MPAATNRTVRIDCPIADCDMQLELKVTYSHAGCDLLEVRGWCGHQLWVPDEQLVQLAEGAVIGW